MGRALGPEVDFCDNHLLLVLDHLQEENQEDVDDPDQPPDHQLLPKHLWQLPMNETSCSQTASWLTEPASLDNPDHFVDSQSPGVLCGPPLQYLQDQEDTDRRKRNVGRADYVIDNDTRFVIAE